MNGLIVSQLIQCLIYYLIWYVGLPELARFCLSDVFKYSVFVTSDDSEKYIVVHNYSRESCGVVDFMKQLIDLLVSNLEFAYVGSEDVIRK